MTADFLPETTAGFSSAAVVLDHPMAQNELPRRVVWAANAANVAGRLAASFLAGMMTQARSSGRGGGSCWCSRVALQPRRSSAGKRETAIGGTVAMASCEARNRAGVAWSIDLLYACFF